MSLIVISTDIDISHSFRSANVLCHIKSYKNESINVHTVPFQNWVIHRN